MQSVPGRADSMKRVCKFQRESSAIGLRKDQLTMHTNMQIVEGLASQQVFTGLLRSVQILTEFSRDVQLCSRVAVST